MFPPSNKAARKIFTLAYIYERLISGLSANPDAHNCYSTHVDFSWDPYLFQGLQNLSVILTLC